MTGWLYTEPGSRPASPRAKPQPGLGHSSSRTLRAALTGARHCTGSAAERISNIPTVRLGPFLPRETSRAARGDRAIGFVDSIDFGNEDTPFYPTEEMSMPEAIRLAENRNDTGGPIMVKLEEDAEWDPRWGKLE